MQGKKETRRGENKINRNFLNQKIQTAYTKKSKTFKIVTGAVE